MAKKIENFELLNPIERIVGKSRQDLTREDIIKVILAKNIERITFHYTGIDGKLKELKLPITSRRYAELILTEGERVDGSSLFKGMVDTGKSDLYVVPQYSTAFLNPFDCCSIDFICRFINPEGNHAEFPPDNISYKASTLLKKKTGLELFALGELEFFLLWEPESNIYPLPKQAGYHGSSPYLKSGPIINEMLRHISQITGNVKYAHGEVGYLSKIDSEFEELRGKTGEQVEIEFLPTPIEDTGDILVLARWIIRNVAYRHNCVATFVPKLEIGHAGSGMHVHMVLRKDGKNAIVDNKGILNNTAKQLIGGLCNYATSLNAFGNTVSSSYLRLVPNQEAPTKVCWSAMNRHALIRVPLGWTGISNLAKKVNPQQIVSTNKFDSRQTVELRSPDGSCNSHLLLAGIATAVKWGLDNPKKSMELAGASEVKTDIKKLFESGKLPNLPGSCEESAEILLANRNLFEKDGIFPDYVIDYLAEQLKQVKDKDMNKKLFSLSDDKRIEESRRIMHRDIHKN
ncbi:MAG: glutamine synthetase family protein [bacterium]